MITEAMKILLSAYADGETTPVETAEAERLLKENVECQKYLAELKNLSVSLHVIKEEPISPDAENNILRRTQREAQMKTNPWKMTATVCASLLVVVLVYQNYSQHKLQGRIRDASVVLMSEQGHTTSHTQQPVVVKATQAFAGAAASLATGGLVTNYWKKGVAGRLKSATDDIGDQYSQAERVEYSRAESLGGTMQYEPYYSNTTLAKDRKSNQESASYFYAAAPAVQQMAAFDRERSNVYADRADFDQYRQYGEGNTEEYAPIYSNQFKMALNEPLSTFSIDVDTASYSNVRRLLSQNQLPPRDAVRVEELVNYFSYDYPDPWVGQPFSITTDLASCPWNMGHQLLRIGLKGKVPAGFSLPASNLVFLIDVSGSMSSQDKLPLLKEGFKMMVQQLRPQDYVSIVVYAGRAGQVLPPTSGVNKAFIMNALDSLQSGGSTAGGEGIQLAYALAKQNFIDGGNNRVVLATDGDFNVGISNVSDLERLVEDKRRDKIFLTVLGFGTGNIKDNRMETLADKGNGNYFYIDGLQEAQKVLVDELGSTLFTIAKDVKIQVEFNPAAVSSYRLIGYENRMLAKEDFNNDFKDAGEIGAGHTVTALYEIEPTGYWPMFNQNQTPGVDPLKYQSNPSTNFNKNVSEVVTVKLRYKEPTGDTSKLITKTVKKADYTKYPTGDFAWAASVAEFGMLLSNSNSRANASYEQVLSLARSNIGKDPNGLRSEFIRLVETARTLDPQPQPVYYDNYYEQNQVVPNNA